MKGMVTSNRGYYTGFNAHLKLLPSDDSGVRNDKLSSCKALDGLPTFARVPISVESISFLTNFWPESLLGDDVNLYRFGFNTADDFIKVDFEVPYFVNDVRSLIGDLNGLLGAVMKDGEILITQVSQNDQNLSLTRCSMLHRSLTHDTVTNIRADAVAIAGNDEVCIASTTISKDMDPTYALNMFSSFAAFREGSKPTSVYILPSAVLSLTAGATAFVSLLEDHSVWTMGSALQPALLARTPTPETPAHRPCQIDALGGLFITKIGMCEWLGAALSEDRDMYIWGGRAGETKRVGALPGLDEEVSLVNIDGGVDIADFALGMGHVAVLTVTGKVWVCGENEYGQLGLGEADKPFVGAWTKTEGPWGDEKRVAVEAGGWGTWVLTEDAILKG